MGTSRHARRLLSNPSLERRPREAGRLSSNVRPHMSRVCKSSKAQPRLSSRKTRWSERRTTTRREEGWLFSRASACHQTSANAMGTFSYLPGRTSTAVEVARFQLGRGSRLGTASHSPASHVSSSAWPRAWWSASFCVAGARPRNTSLWAGRSWWLCHLLRQRHRPTVRPNPSLERRPHEAGRLSSNVRLHKTSYITFHQHMGLP